MANLTHLQRLEAEGIHIIREVMAVESEAKTLPEVIQETLLTTTSERQGRVIEKDAGCAGMEVKKQQGYF